MTDFIMNDHILNKECKNLALEIVTEFHGELAEDETLEDKRDEIFNRVHETVDGHEWIIYHHKSIMICAHCNTDQGEEWFEETGMPQTSTFGSLASIIAYGEMHSRIMQEADELIEDGLPQEPEPDSNLTRHRKAVVDMACDVLFAALHPNQPETQFQAQYDGVTLQEWTTDASLIVAQADTDDGIKITATNLASQHFLMIEIVWGMGAGTCVNDWHVEVERSAPKEMQALRDHVEFLAI